MIDKLEELKKRYLEVESDLSKPETVSDMGLFKKLNKEYKSLGKIVTAYHQYKGVQYDKIIPLLIEGIKELKEKVKHIEENCDCLKK